ncbi:MAG: hypothetical protein HOQ28_11345 [Thermoleophilia bacterium]|nr:hypothetical protein [Thermoleophilia bacterium]
MRRLPVLLLPVLAVALGAALIAHAGSDGGTAFRSPDAGAACRVVGPALVCSSLGSRGSVALRGAGGARIVSGLPWWDASTRVVHRWHRGALSCRLAGSAIVCSNGRTAIRVTADGFTVHV